MSDLYDVKLLTRLPDDEPFSQGRMTIRLNDLGDPITVTGAPALEQDILKAIFTGNQPDGYGTFIHGALGVKNTVAKRAGIMYSIMASLKRLLQVHAAQSSLLPTYFKGARVFAGIGSLRVSVPDSTSVSVSLEAYTNADEIIAANAVARIQR